MILPGDIESSRDYMIHVSCLQSIPGKAQGGKEVHHSYFNDVDVAGARQLATASPAGNPFLTQIDHRRRLAWELKGS